MDIVGRYLRWLFPATALLFLLLGSGLHPHLLLLTIVLAVYAVAVELYALFRKAVPLGSKTAFAACDVILVALLCVSARSELLLLFDLLILVWARLGMDDAHFLFVASAAGLSYFAAIAYVLVFGLVPGGISSFLFLVILQPVLITGGTVLAVRIACDAKRQVEGERGELLRKLDATTDTLATISHEFRTPLTMIRSSCQILHDERPGLLTAVQRRFLGTIDENTSRLIQLSDELLARMKIHSAWLTVELAELDIRPIVKNVVETMAPFAEQRSRHLRYSYPHFLSPVLADSKWIHQVLVNLIHNAIKYTESGGSVVLSVKENEECAVVTVSDDGMGVWTSHTTDVFRKYFQENRHIEGTSDGAGLGLAIVKQVIEKHNGKVYVSSVPGMGSTFSFTLPIFGRSRRET